jgi:hypothetical protein
MQATNNDQQDDHSTPARALLFAYKVEGIPKWTLSETFKAVASNDENNI